MRDCRIALIGDFDASVPAHQAIPLALEMAAEHHHVSLEAAWIHTSQIGDAATALASFDGIWCVPASPYASMQGALNSIRFARENGVPFVGTCGGFQHALIEYARNASGMPDADHAETNPSAASPVIIALSCSLVEKAGELILAESSILRRSYGQTRVVEEYRCSYGPNPARAGELFSNGFRATAHDLDGAVRGGELETHPFFVGTLFQPERRALRGEMAPLVRDFVGAALAQAETPSA